MKRRITTIAGVAAVVVYAAAFAVVASRWAAGLRGTAGDPTPNGTLSLIVEPDDGIAPVLAAIRGATRSIDLGVYELDDPAIETALADAVARGIAVRVMLSAGYDGARSAVNGPAYGYLDARGVPVRWSPGYFSLTHEKSLVIDGTRAIVMTFNLVAKYYATGRDFGAVDGDAGDVAAIERTFAADWSDAGSEREGNNGARGDDLLWSPGSEDALLGIIRGAHRSLAVYNEEMADGDVTKALIDAAWRGVSVRVVMTGSSQWKWAFAELATAGVQVRTFADDPSAPLYIHAKAIVADEGLSDARAFVGSENFSKASLYRNRELGIVTGDPGIIAGVARTFVADWQAARPFVMP